MKQSKRLSVALALILFFASGGDVRGATPEFTNWNGNPAATGVSSFQTFNQAGKRGVAFVLDLASASNTTVEIWYGGALIHQFHNGPLPAGKHGYVYGRPPIGVNYTVKIRGPITYDRNFLV